MGGGPALKKRRELQISLIHKSTKHFFNRQKLYLDSPVRRACVESTGRIMDARDHRAVDVELGYGCQGVVVQGKGVDESSVISAPHLSTAVGHRQ